MRLEPSILCLLCTGWGFVEAQIALPRCGRPANTQCPSLFSRGVSIWDGLDDRTIDKERSTIACEHQYIPDFRILIMQSEIYRRFIPAIVSMQYAWSPDGKT